MVTVINLIDYKPRQSTSYSGRPQGEELRRTLKLDELDRDKSEVEIIIPAGTTSFNPSFFLGFLFNSIKNLGVEGFNKKYKLVIQDSDPDFRSNLFDNLADGMRNAINSINKVSATDFLRKRK